MLAEPAQQQRGTLILEVRLVGFGTTEVSGLYAIQQIKIN